VDPRPVAHSFDEVFLDAWESKRSEVIVLTLDDENRPPRRPHPSLAGKMKIHGDIFDSVMPG